MSDLTLVQYDTAPSVFGTLTNITQSQLENAQEIRFQMRLENQDRYKVNAAASVYDAAGKIVQYDWDDADLSMPGDYVARWRIVHQDGSIQHSEPENSITISPA